MPLPEVKPGQEQDEYMGECMPFLKGEDKSHEQKVAMCLTNWRRAKGIKEEGEVDIIEKIDKYLEKRINKKQGGKNGHYRKD